MTYEFEGGKIKIEDGEPTFYFSSDFYWDNLAGLDENDVVHLPTDKSPKFLGFDLIISNDEV